MRRVTRFLIAGNLLLGAVFFGACETVPQGIQQARLEMSQTIAAEPAGDYFIGRRYYKSDYKFWGYIRRPGQPWSTAELVMLNEKQKLAPDRERVDIGSDNNYEYKLYGFFSGDKVYEPASNGIYPEFVLKGYQLISTNPPPIFKSQFRGHATAEDLRYVVDKPEWLPPFRPAERVTPCAPAHRLVASRSVQGTARPTAGFYDRTCPRFR
jgi:hypothetical protein